MSLTAQPPRRDMYELETELGTRKVPSFLPANRRIRIGADNDTERAFIYNADYMSDGTRYARFDRPWTAFASVDFRTFTTHAEALQWATQEAAKR